MKRLGFYLQMLMIILILPVVLIVGIDALRLVPIVGGALLVLASSLLFVCAVRYTLFGNLYWKPSAGTQNESDSRTGWKAWRASVCIFVLFFVFPLMMTALGSSAVNERAIMGAVRIQFTGTSWANFLEETGCILVIFITVLLVPQLMHDRRGPFRPSSRLPGWLAGLAAIVTAIYIIALHFDRYVLPTSNLGVLSFAAFGAAALLAPFYKAVARACWDRGTAAVFDPEQWWQYLCGALNDITGSSTEDIARKQVAAETTTAINAAVLDDKHDD